VYIYYTREEKEGRDRGEKEQRRREEGRKKDREFLDVTS